MEYGLTILMYSDLLVILTKSFFESRNDWNLMPHEMVMDGPCEYACFLLLFNVSTGFTARRWNVFGKIVFGKKSARHSTPFASLLFCVVFFCFGFFGSFRLLVSSRCRSPLVSPDERMCHKERWKKYAIWFAFKPVFISHCANVYYRARTIGCCMDALALITTLNYFFFFLGSAQCRASNGA